MKVLHIAADDNFIDYTIDQFAKVEDIQSEYWAFTADENKMLCNVKNQSLVKAVRFKYADIDKYVEAICNYDLVVFHNLYCLHKCLIAVRIPETVKVAWAIWGAEVYNVFSEFSDWLHKPLTQKYLTNWYGFNRENLVKQAIMRTDFYYGGSKEGYDLLMSVFPIKAKWAWYVHLTMEHVFYNGLPEAIVDGKNILVGNSSTDTSNHFDTISELTGFCLEGRQVIVPLSYGDSTYRDKVLEYGYSKLGKSFSPLLNFLEREEYNRVISSCSVAIFDNKRQQAFGNIVTLLWLGARVYLNECNVSYRYLKRLGIKVFSIDSELNSSNRDVFAPLDEDIVLENRRILLAEFSEANVVARNVATIKSSC